MRRYLGCFLATLTLAVGFRAQAAPNAVISSPTARVYENPQQAGEGLVDLPQGQAVEVVGRRADWVQVRVTLKGGFTFKGWVLANQIRWAKSRGVSPPAAPKPSRPVPVRRPTPTPPPPPVRTPPPPSREFGGEREGFLAERLRLSARPSILIFQYSLDSAGATPGEVFSYKLMGLGFEAGVDYAFMEAWNDRIAFSAQLAYLHALYYFKTKLADAAGSEFASLNTKNSSNDLTFRTLAKYRFGSEARSPAAGLSLGFQWYRFNGDDVENDTGPINLYVSQKRTSIMTGVAGFIPVGETLDFEIGSDVLLLNFIGESPQNATGTSPSAAMGFVPYLRGSWAMGDHHAFDATYRLLWQNYTFEGTGSRTLTGNVTDGSVKNRVHSLGLGYTYRF